ncbi:PRC-barrel domain-containing protein [Actinoplanes sp. GCM10030250]|uniref:PRC-barrel domain-containing protein n=1 Tax=Actinoplanes sp. GCM10030250 TaxID=3273376 RepID=UPI003613B853
MQPTPFTPWSWRDPSSLAATYDQTDTESVEEGARSGVDLVGYKVEATDGHIGSIDQASYDVGSAHVVVDTGPWIFGRKVLLPAGTVQTVDHAERKVYVDRTKEQIKTSPEYDKDTFESPEYRDEVGDYYTGSYRDYPH